MTGRREGGLRWMGRPAALAATLAAVALAGAAPPATAGSNVWTSLGPDGGFVETVVGDPAHPQVLYAGSRGGVFKSVDGGASWRAASRGLLIHPITALAVDSHQPGTVYAAAGDTTTLEVGLAVSRDGGATWSQTVSFSNGYARDGGEEHFSSVAVDPAHRGTVFAASNFAIYVSHDRGQGWSGAMKAFGYINPQDGLSVQLVADPNRGSVFAYVAGAYLFEEPNPYVKLFESTDGGATWSDHSAALPAGTGARLAIEPTSPGILYLLQAGKIFRSLDGAASWRETRSAGLPIAAGPHGLVVAGNLASGTVKSGDGGRTWEEIATPPIDAVTGYAFGPAPGQIYASGNALGVMASDDGGQSWHAANHGLTATSVLAVAVDPSRPTRLYAALADGDSPLRISGVWKTPNGGATWRPIGSDLAFAGTDPVDQASLFVVDPAQDGHALLRHRHLRRPQRRRRCLLDASPLSAQRPPGKLRRSAACLAAGRLCGLAAPCRGMLRLQERGRWRDLELSAAAEDLSRGAGAVGSLRRLCCRLRLFQRDEGALPVAERRRRGELGADQHGASFRVEDRFRSSDARGGSERDAQRLFVASITGVWRSLDGGAHWSETDKDLPLATAAQFPFSYAPLLAVDPSNPLLVYAEDGCLGVYRSLDGGDHWRPILAGLPPLNRFSGGADLYEALTPDPRHSGTVYLATVGDGLLSYTSK